VHLPECHRHSGNSADRPLFNVVKKLVDSLHGSYQSSKIDPFALPSTARVLAFVKFMFDLKSVVQAVYMGIPEFIDAVGTSLSRLKAFSPDILVIV
jgi:hypothetical protein